MWPAAVATSNAENANVQAATPLGSVNSDLAGASSVTTLPLPAKVLSQEAQQSKQYKTFSWTQIREKINQRKDIPEYRTLLMESVLVQDAIGATFDSTHMSWKRLVKLVVMSGLCSC